MTEISEEYKTYENAVRQQLEYCSIVTIQQRAQIKQAYYAGGHASLSVIIDAIKNNDKDATKRLHEDIEEYLRERGLLDGRL